MASARRDPRPARTRAAIIAAASELLAARGVEGTTILRVAQQAGVSVGSIYVHFTSKSELIAALGVLAIRPRVEALPRADSALNRVAAVGDAYLRFAIEDPSLFNALTVRAHEPQPTGELPWSSELAGIAGDLITALESDLAEAMGAGEIRRVPVRQALVALVASWMAIADLAARRDGLAISEELAWSSRKACRALVLGIIGSTAVRQRGA